MRTRVTRNLSRAKLAEMAGVNANSLAKWEKAGMPDGKYPPLPKLTRICQLLEIDPRYIFNIVYMREEQKWSAPNGDISEASKNPIFETTDSFNFVKYFKAKSEGYQTEYIISKLQQNEYEVDQLHKSVARVEALLSEAVASIKNENGPDQEDPGHPTQNPPKAAPTASNQPSRKEDQK